MVNTIALQNKRDKKEREIDTVVEAEKVNEDQAIRIQSEKSSMIREYQIWKKEHDIEGIKY